MRLEMGCRSSKVMQTLSTGYQLHESTPLKSLKNAHMEIFYCLFVLRLETLRYHNTKRVLDAVFRVSKQKVTRARTSCISGYFGLSLDGVLFRKAVLSSQSIAMTSSRSK